MHVALRALRAHEEARPAVEIKQDKADVGRPKERRRTLMDNIIKGKEGTPRTTIRHRVTNRAFRGSSHSLLAGRVSSR